MIAFPAGYRPKDPRAEPPHPPAEKPVKINGRQAGALSRPDLRGHPATVDLTSPAAAPTPVLHARPITAATAAAPGSQRRADHESHGLSGRHPSQ
ncbi:hypothetical protein GCM10020358_36390 [Amorphoplanes nipponensis]|uniref:Uncharacterized protein n=1 Tax=Actinoplanes nipponensis TaxID=135950 RepID=A0A919MKZ2_9ACTN|nr:hypothetical protein Ani05nite_25300 [Actinoplanes nipponensis]